MQEDFPAYDYKSVMHVNAELLRINCNASTNSGFFVHNSLYKLASAKKFQKRIVYKWTQPKVLPGERFFFCHFFFSEYSFKFLSLV